jgi:signal transduction histidine kinase
MTDTGTPRRPSRARQWVFLGGLTVLLGATAAYVRIQTPVRDSIELERQLARNVGRIMTLDEILTMSARMAAGAHDTTYEERYNAHVDELDQLIRATIALVPDAEVAAAVGATDEANRRLVAMETRSFELNKDGRHEEALKLLESVPYRADKAVYAGGMERAFGLLEKLTATRHGAMEYRAHLLQILALAALALVLVTWTLEQRERTRELAQRNQAMRTVLDAVQEGLVGIDTEGWIAPVRSASVDRWFGPVEGRLKFADYVRSHDAAFASWFELQLQQLRDGLLPIEVCLAQMPALIRMGERTFQVSYQPILANGICGGLLVVLDDITAKIERERAEAEQRDLIRVLEHIGRDRTGFLNFFHGAETMVSELLAPGTSQVVIARQVHTLKGTAAQFGLLTLAQLCHGIEERVREGLETTALEREMLDHAWQRLAGRIRAVCGERSHQHLEVHKSDYSDVVQLIQRRRNHESILSAMAAWELDPVQARLDRLGESARALADRLGKPGLEVVCEGNGLRTSNADWAPLWSSCVHVIRNAVDHGIEPATARSAAGKSEAGHMVLSATREADEVVIRVSDDGVGIDWDALGRKAAEAGIPFDTDEARIAALFRDGLSSRDQVTDVSGRGIGLAAVLQEVKRLGGAIAVTSKRGQGTTVEMHIPAPAMVGRQVARRA